MRLIDALQVGSKLDKAGTNRAVSELEGRTLAEAHGANFCEVSSKSRENVRKPFIEIVDAIVGNPELISAANSGRTPGTVAVGSESGYMRYVPGCSC